MTNDLVADVQQKKWPLWFKLLIFVLGLVGLLLLLWLFWAGGMWSIRLVADSFANELAIYVPLNEGFLKAATYLIFLLLIPISFLIFSISPRKRFYGMVSLALFLAAFNGIIGYAAINFKVNPISGAPEKCYLFTNGKVVYYDLVKGNARRFDPITGQECIPITPEMAAKLSRWENGEKPNLISYDNNPDLFDRTLGTAIVWYHKGGDGRIELFDNPGFHPNNAQPLMPITPDVGREWRTQRDEWQNDQRSHLKKQQQEQKKRAEAGDRCDQLAGNKYDPRRNSRFLPVSYQILASQTSEAIEHCQSAVDANPQNPRYRYQLARAYQSGNPDKAFPLLQQLTREQYPAAFDNLGWVYKNQRQIALARDMFHSGATLGSAEAMVSYADLLLGLDQRENEREAFEWYHKAALKGHPRGIRQMEEYQKKLQAQQIGGAIVKGVIEGLLRNRN